jgi:hypothetical protein
MTYPEVERLFGTPISELSKPVLPFIGLRSKKLILLFITALAAYGAYKLFKETKDRIEERDIKK